MYLLGKSLVGFGHFGEDAGVLLGNDGADDQQRTDHQGHSDQQVDKHVLDQARMKLMNDTWPRSAHRGSHEHVVQVVVQRALAGGDGGVGDGEQWVVHNRRRSRQPPD